MTGKIKDLKQLSNILSTLRKTKKIGLITGCFDVLHTGHIDLFQFAKENIDILVVGIDTDEAIRKTKGALRPINSQKNRAKVLSAIEDVDYILLLSSTHEFSTEKANKYYDEVVLALKPTHLITSRDADSYREVKKCRIKAVGGTLLIDIRKKPTSTSKVITKILELEL